MLFVFTFLFNIYVDVKLEWPPRETMMLGYHNVIHESLVKQEKIILPPLHIKVGLMKQFAKALQHRNQVPKAQGHLQKNRRCQDSSS